MPDRAAPDGGFQAERRYCPECEEPRWFEWRPASNRLTLAPGLGEMSPPRFGWYCAVCGYRL